MLDDKYEPVFFCLYNDTGYVSSNSCRNVFPTSCAARMRLRASIISFEQKERQREEVHAAAAKSSMYQSKCSCKLEHVLVKHKLPSQLNNVELTAVIRVIKEQMHDAMSKKRPELKLLYENLKH